MSQTSHTFDGRRPPCPQIPALLTGGQSVEGDRLIERTLDLMESVSELEEEVAATRRAFRCATTPSDWRPEWTFSIGVDVTVGDLIDQYGEEGLAALSDKVEAAIDAARAAREQVRARERVITDAWMREQEERFLGLEAFKAALAAEEATGRPFSDFERFLARVLADNNADRLPIDGALHEHLAEQAIAAVRAQEPAARFRVVSAAEFAATPSARWRVKGVLPESGLAMVYGAPGSGKSFFALDLCALIARGQAWRGRRTTQGRVAYVAAEGCAGFAVRMRAYLKANGLDRLDGLGVIGETPNFFTSSGDHHALAEAVQVWGGADVIVVDTLAASSSGADENTAKELGAVLGKLGKLQAATGALVILIHHSGKDESKGARGWSGLKAAVDTEIEVSRPNDEEPGRVARVTKQKDGESGAVFPFRLERVELGVDADGEPITSCVVEVIDEIPRKRAKTAGVAAARRPRGQWKRMAFDIVEARRTVAFDEVVDKVAEEMPAPEPDKRDQRRGNARRDIDALIRDGFLETTGGGKSLRLAGMGELM